MKRIVTTILLVLIMGVVATPMLQHVFQFGNDGSLYGDVGGAANESLSLKGWWDGEYQEQKTKYLNDSTGFRPWIVRVNNQVDYSLFKRVHARIVVAGKDNYLYEQPYIDSYCGKDNVADSTINKELYKIKKVQDTLTAMGVDFVFVYAPSKGRFYPEYFPSGYTCTHPENAVYFKYKKGMDALSINYIDFNDWFVKMKDTSSHLLMSKQGIHWTTYGAMLAGDSLIKYIEKKRNITMRHMVFMDVEKTTKDKKNDADIAYGLNLLAPVTTDTFTFANIYFTDEDSTTDKPNAIFLGDSFSLTYRNFWWPDNIFDNWEYWYYAHQVWDQDAFYGRVPVIPFDGYQWQDTLAKSDILIMQYAEIKLGHFEGEFIDKAYAHYYGDK